jgi:hypothetical protein
MQSIVSRRPSPALLVAVLALIAAVGGTAIAGPQATTSAITKKDVKRIAKKQAVKQIKKALGGLKATKISYSAAANTGAKTIFAGAGLRLAASCGAAGELDLNATTTKNDSNIFLTSVVATGTNTTFGFNQENQNFDAGSTIEVEEVLGDGDQENAAVQYVAPDGTVATVQVALDDGDAPQVCQVSGFGMAG